MAGADAGRDPALTTPRTPVPVDGDAYEAFLKEQRNEALDAAARNYGAIVHLQHRLGDASARIGTLEEERALLIGALRKAGVPLPSVVEDDATTPDAT